MLRIAIAEDNPASAEQLATYIRQFCDEQSLEYTITRFDDGEALVRNYRPAWDLLLLDIEMPNMDGMQAAEQIRKIDPEVVIIFVTQMARYAIKGYEVDAMDFILKPVQYPSFALKLRKAVSWIESRDRQCLLVNLEGVARKTPIADLLYIEVRNHQLEIHTMDAVYTLRGTLQSMEDQLEGQAFSRCNVSYLVNLKNVKYVEGDMVYLAKGKLPISRSRKKPFLQDLASYIGGNFK